MLFSFFFSPATIISQVRKPRCFRRYCCWWPAQVHSITAEQAYSCRFRSAFSHNFYAKIRGRTSLSELQRLYHSSTRFAVNTQVQQNVKMTRRVLNRMSTLNDVKTAFCSCSQANNTCFCLRFNKRKPDYFSTSHSQTFCTSHSGRPQCKILAVAVALASYAT